MVKKTLRGVAEGERQPLQAHRINSEIGRQIRARRHELGLTQKMLAERVGVSQQQILKYEQGAGRIPSDRLLRLCSLLEIDFPTLSQPLQTLSFEPSGFSEPAQADFAVEAFSDRNTVALVRAFQKIADPTVRRKVLSLVKTMADDRSDVTKPSQAKPLGKFRKP